MKVVFTPGLYSGNKKIDGQHIHMFEMANQMIGVIEAGVSGEELVQQANEFADYVVYHTVDEDLFMNETSYPKRYEHKKKHEEIRRKARELMEHLTETDEMEEMKFTVLEFVVDYALGHIKEYDLEMTEFFNIRLAMNSML